MPEPRPIARAAAADHTRRAADAAHDDADHAARTASAAAALDPLQGIQVALDQLARQAEDRGRGLPWPHDMPFGRYVMQTMEHAGRLRDVLRCAAAAADSMISHTRDQVAEIDTGAAMSQDDPNQPPQLTPSG